MKTDLPMRAILLILLPAAAILSIGCGDSSSKQNGQKSAPSDSWSIDNATLIFSGKRAGATGLYLLKPGGSTEPLTAEPMPSANFARPSPDGSRLLFQSRPEGVSDIFVMKADGTDAVNVTNDPAWEVLPVWSPDGNRIAFMSTRGYELGGIGPFPGHIYVADPDGGNPRAVTRTPLTSALGPSDWSPDGNRLLFSRFIDGQIELFQVDVRTGAETRWTSSPANEYGGAFSPDGKHVAFHSETEASSQIAIMALDGGARRELTSGPGFRFSPRWSPDGSWIAFAVRGEDGRQYDLHAIRVEDGFERVLLATPEDEREGSWIP